MTDRSDQPPDGVEERLERHFAAEVTRAERDVRRGWTARPVPTRRRLARSRRTAASLATLAVAAVLVVGSATLGAGWFARPTPSASPPVAVSTLSPSPSNSASPTVASAAPVVDSSYADGLPSSIGGVPVLRPGDALTHAAATTDRTPFLVGGWLTSLGVVVTPPRPCAGGTCVAAAALDDPTLGNEPGGRELWGRILGLVRLRLQPAPNAIVVRVHVADEDAAGCRGIRFDCASAMVPEAVVWADGQLTPGTYADGIPMAVDGQPVWRPGDVAARLASATDDTPFLLGGWHYWPDGRTVGCLPQPPVVSPLLGPPCESGQVMSDHSGPYPVGGVAVVGSEMPIAEGQAVVLRVHIHDPRTADCPAAQIQACAAAIVIEAVVWSAPAPAPAPVVDTRYPDGLPSSLDGQPVLRADGGRAHARAATDASTFLVGGWSRGAVAYSCPIVRVDQASEPMLPRCGDTVLDDVPLPGPSTASMQVLDPGGSLRLQPGLLVLRVHARDPRAEACLPADLAACRSALIVDAVVWQGDAVVDTGPLTIQDVALRLQQPWPDIGIGLRAAPGDKTEACLAGFAVPAVTWKAVPEPLSFAMSANLTILVYPTPEEAAGATELAPPAGCPIFDGVRPIRTIQDNVVILVWGPIRISRGVLAGIRAALKVDIHAPRY